MKETVPNQAWVAIGIGVGLALGVALDNIAIGLALGVAMYTTQNKREGSQTNPREELAEICTQSAKSAFDWAVCLGSHHTLRKEQ